MPQPLAKGPHFEPMAAQPVDVSARLVAPLGTDQVQWSESPARLLHERLVATFVAPPPAPSPESFSPRVKLAILVSSSAILWIAIGAAIAAFA